jgi:acyl-CoA synthetase (AMP-forming)/AMP-acid ligase II
MTCFILTCIYNCTNILALYEAHFGVPMAGAELNTLNVRLNASTIALFLGHSSTVVMMVDQEYFALAEEALKIWVEKIKDTSFHSYMS